jgi:hypothetical protein
MPDIFLYGPLSPVSDIRLCDPTGLCVAAPVVVVIPGARVRRRVRRHRQQEEAELVRDLLGPPPGSPAPVWQRSEQDLGLLILLEDL